jgi:hypothetical protein
MGFLAWDRYEFPTLDAKSYSDSVTMFLVFIVPGNHILFLTRFLLNLSDCLTNPHRRTCIKFEAATFTAFFGTGNFKGWFFKLAIMLRIF